MKDITKKLFVVLWHRFYISLTGLLLLTLLCLGLGSAIELDEVINRTVKRYENLKSFYTHFTQTLCDEVSGICQSFNGEIYFLRPNYFRMEIEKPRQILVGDSASLWIYMPDKKKAIRQKLGQMPVAVNPDIFLKDYKERFNGELSSHKKDCYEITLRPKEETEIYEKIVVVINKNFEINGITIIDEAGAENKFIFDNTQLNKNISKNLFRFNPPKGTEVIEQ